MLCRDRLAGDDRRDDAFLDDRLEQGFLAVEIKVQRSLRDARARRDVFQPRGGETPLDEQRERGRRQLGRAGFLAAFSRRIRIHHGRFNDCLVIKLSFPVPGGQSGGRLRLRFLAFSQSFQ